MTDSLADFLAHCVKPYDPETDTYRRPPFALPVKAGKNSAIYNAHTYHTKVPPEGILPYIEHYTDPGDLVLDPFCGSGMTGVAALMSGRSVILNDLSPAAAHIARNYTRTIDVDAFRKEFEHIKSSVQNEFNWLYATSCEKCGSEAVTHYTIWSDVFECGRCGKELIFWDIATNKETAETLKKFDCPFCGKIWQKFQLKRLTPIPVFVNIDCNHCAAGRHNRPVAVM